MRPALSKKTLTIVLALVVFVVGTLIFVVLGGQEESQTEPTEVTENLGLQRKVIGTSVEGRAIESFTYGNGDTHLVFVGGIHGGYEWNSVLLSYQFIDYLDANPGVVPEDLTVSVIPSANPDGIYEVIGKEGRFSTLNVPSSQEATIPGRFNANEVDLNRNFDCKWQPTSTWRGNVVSAGSGAFSEPEAVAIRDFVLASDPMAVVFWHSQANAVYASECEAGVLPETLAIMNVYSSASGYSPVESFDAYEITGDAEGWLASINIPAITVELETHQTIEWDRNLAGVKALFKYYST